VADAALTSPIDPLHAACIVAFECVRNEFARARDAVAAWDLPEWEDDHVARTR
jgi:hypothetical protein